jgi:hypothetical protein
VSRPTRPPAVPVLAPFVVPPKPYAIRQHIIETCLVMAGVGWAAPRWAWAAAGRAAVVAHVIAGALALVAAVGAAWVATGLAGRRFATLRIDAQGIVVERKWPRLARRYPWAALQEWRHDFNPHRGLRVQLRFTDGCRVPLYVGKHANWQLLVRTLEAVRPAGIERVRTERWTLEGS